MNTIEERAEAFVDNYLEADKHFAEECYLVGAKEQKVIDDEEYSEDIKEFIDRIRKAYCAHNCPHLVEYCWQDDIEIPCAGMRAINKAMEDEQRHDN